MKPIAFQAMYSRISTNEVGKLFKHLADLRPEMIIPEVIDRVYATLDSVTEPHKMTAALQCLVSFWSGLGAIVKCDSFLYNLLWFHRWVWHGP